MVAELLKPATIFLFIKLVRKKFLGKHSCGLLIVT